MANYSLLDALTPDPEATADGHDHRLRQVRSCHYVPVSPTPLPDPVYIAHSSTLFHELGLNDELAQNEGFCRIFSGDLSAAPAPLRPCGWATGYALLIYRTEYVRQCPFGTGNGYGGGRAISVFEGVFRSCAVLRSSVREFLAQEHMHALGIPTSRSLTLYASTSENVVRPWYAPDSRSSDPDIMVKEPVAISTRVAPSFLGVGQLELFARRVRANAHPGALEELRLVVAHLIARDYGSFGFCESFDPAFQPWPTA